MLCCGVPYGRRTQPDSCFLKGDDTLPSTLKEVNTQTMDQFDLGRTFYARIADACFSCLNLTIELTVRLPDPHKTILQRFHNNVKLTRNFHNRTCVSKGSELFTVWSV
jgi:hypothetical protein